MDNHRTPQMHTVYLSLGTNLGNTEENIQRAYSLIEQNVGRITKQSSYYRSEPWGFESDNEFLNTAICCETPLAPHQLLHATQTIERTMGRTHKSVNREYHDRIIDIDILLYDNLQLQDEQLTIPHPLMNQRPFVMEPLSEIM